METIVPVGVHRPFAFNTTTDSSRIRLKAASDFPDPRLFDFDDNGLVDANDVIQETQIRRETQAAVDARSPLSKYAAQSKEVVTPEPSTEPSEHVPAEPVGLSIHA